MRAPERIPYVIGQWVRGERFYGRERLIAEILEGPRNSIWLLGTRRIGKTSLLKQLEHINIGNERGFLPVFWDFQGADDPEELALSFTDALLEAEDRLEALGIPVTEIAGDELFASMATLRRRLRSKGLDLLLLCDEVEELLNLHRKDPALLRKLRRALQSQEGVRSVLASSVRLFALADERGDTSPFLHGFTPPLYINGLSDDESRSLILQDRQPDEARPRFDEREVETIRSRCDNHPYLVQLVCKRFLELGELDEACEQVAADPMVSYFFSVDFDMLSASEQSMLGLLAEQGPSTSEVLGQARPDESGAAALQRLTNLGFIHRAADGRYELSGFFFRRWLVELPDPHGRGDGQQGVAGRQTPGAVPSYGSSDETLSLTTVDDRYTLHDTIGDGATGTVFKARDTLLDTWVALKLLRPEYTADPRALERVRQEIILSRDIGHPNILRTYHLGAHHGRTYLTMRWIDGRNLAEAIEEDAPFPLETALEIAIRLASALAAAHAHKILHRDIKPSNILLDAGGEPHLADFGLARLIGSPGQSSAGLFVGTPHYASPEQVSLVPLDERSDLYSFGLVLFEMCTGRRPFEADDLSELLAKQRSEVAPDPRTVNPDVPEDLAALILRCLAKDPGDRFANAEELEAALRKLAG
jgi:serine/threonine-protein kinase